MFWLPSLPLTTGRLQLPVCDRALPLLMQCAIRSSAAAALEPARAALALDPFLALWCLCIVGRSGRRAGTLDELAEWLATSPADIWLADHDEPHPTSNASHGEALAECARRACRVARRASQVAREQGLIPSDRAYLRGLVHEYPLWLPLLAAPDETISPDALAGWLGHALGTSDDHGAPGEVAMLARASDDARRASSTTCVTSDAVACDEDHPSIWDQRIDGLAGLFPLLMEKLQRLCELETSFEAALEREKLASLAEFAAGAGHEINNPLGVISGRAQLALRDEQDPERRRGLTLMHAQAMRVHEMIADLMLFARPPRPQRVDCELGELLDQVAATLANAAEARQVTLVRMGDRTPQVASVDPVQFKVGIKALLENAIRATARGTQVRYSLARQNTSSMERVPPPSPRSSQEAPRSWTVVTVQDDGQGIPPEVRRHLFDPFFSGRSAGRGLGMGLAKCWRIVTNHDGRIEVDSLVGHGTTFRVFL